MATSPPTVSVVVTTCNRRERLPEVLEPLLADPGALEIIVVIDACHDGSLELVEQLAREHPVLRPLMLTENVGQGRARMAGARAARGDVILSLDDDVIATPAWSAATGATTLVPRAAWSSGTCHRRCPGAGGAARSVRSSTPGVMRSIAENMSAIRAPSSRTSGDRRNRVEIGLRRAPFRLRPAPATGGAAVARAEDSSSALARFGCRLRHPPSSAS
jgi:glycosyltransferase involved in cell wall biosynthesis